MGWNGRCSTEDLRLTDRDLPCANSCRKGKTKRPDDEMWTGKSSRIQTKCPTFGPQHFPSSPWVPPSTTNTRSLLRCKHGSPRHLWRALRNPLWNLCLSPLLLLYTRNYKLLHFSRSPYKYKRWSYLKTISSNYTTLQCWRSLLRMYLHSHLYSLLYITQLLLARGNLQVQLKLRALTHII